MLKRLIKNTISYGSQALGLPHNRTPAQIRAIKSAFVDSDLDRQRVHLLAASTQQSEAVVEGQIAEFRRQHEGEIEETTGQWKTTGGSMMSLRDRLSLDLLVRAVKPHLAVETGTDRGASATVILQHLDSPEGRLVSVDLAGPHSDRYGELIPDALRGRWELRLQSGSPLLPQVLQELAPIDLFLHDSNHSVRHMRWEYELAWPSLRPGGCLASHDIVTGTAFEDFGSRHADEISGGGAIGNLGFWIKRRQ